MMKIAMLGQKRVPSREGGVEIVVEKLSTRMVRLGHKVTCFNRRGHHVSGKEFDSSIKTEYKGVTLRSVFTLNRKGLAAVTSSFFGALWAAFWKFDVVHFHAEGPALMCFIPKLFKKRVIVTVHGLDHKRIKWGSLASRYILCGECMAVKFADKIIVLSKGVKRYFKETYGIDTVFIPNGVEKPQIKPAKNILEKWNLTSNSYILFLGRLVPEKGVHYLLEAYKNINTDKKLVIAGGVSDSLDYLESLKNLASSNVIFMGFQQGQILEELYSNAYVYCLPSDLEGMPLSLLEAMSYGNCCLTSDIAECTEVIENKACTFKKGDVKDLQNQLQMLCRTPELVQQYKEHAADFICKKYNWNNIVEETLKLYKK